MVKCKKRWYNIPMKLTIASGLFYGDSEYTLVMFALIAVFILSLIAQGQVRSKFRRYSTERAASGKSARLMLEELIYREGLDTRVERLQGAALSDHYDPRSNTVGLSAEVYDSDSVSALAVAAHELGHVLQYKEGYGGIRFRNAVLPAARIGSAAGPWLIILGLVLSLSSLMYVGIGLYAGMLLFQLVTLPVEFNASSRALRLLEDGCYVSYEQSDNAKKVLRAAAMTYVWAAVASFLTLLRFLLLANNRRR